MFECYDLGLRILTFPRTLVYHPFLSSYMNGADQEMYGLQLSEEYDGMLFGEVASKLHAKTGMLVVAMQIKGKVKCNPSYARVTAGAVVYVKP